MVARKPKTEKKVRINIALSPALKTAVKKAQGDYSNLSAFLEEAGWRELKRLKKAPGHFRDTKGKSA